MSENRKRITVPALILPLSLWCGCAAARAASQADSWQPYFQEGQSAQTQSRPTLAEQNFKEALKRSLRARDDKAAAICLISLGWAEYTLTKYKEADKCFEQALPLCLAQFGAKGRTYAKCVELLSRTKRHLGQLPESENLGNKYLALVKTAQGADSDEYAFGLRNLGKLYIARKQYVKAEQVLSQSASILESNHGPRYSLLGNSLLYLRDTYLLQGNGRAALAVEARIKQTTPVSQDQLEMGSDILQALSDAPSAPKQQAQPLPQPDAIKK